MKIFGNQSVLMIIQAYYVFLGQIFKIFVFKNSSKSICSNTFRGFRSGTSYLFIVTSTYADIYKTVVTIDKTAENLSWIESTSMQFSNVILDSSRWKAWPVIQVLLQKKGINCVREVEITLVMLSLLFLVQLMRQSMFWLKLCQ